MKRIYIVLLIIILLLCSTACKSSRYSNRQNGSDTLQVYYAYKEQYQTKGNLIGKIDVPITKEADLLHLALIKIMEAPASEEMISAFPENVKIISYDPDEGVISINISPNYNAMSSVERSIARACLVLTLCNLDEVDAVSIYVEDTLIDSELKADDIILPDYEESEYEKQLTLYFSDLDSSFLEKEQHTLTIGQDRLLVEYVMDELIRGPQDSNLKSAIPEGTKILSIELTKNLCKLNLSNEFVKNKPETAAGERVAIYSIVNSITAITGIEAVQILIEGEKLDKYFLISLDEPLTKNEEIIWIDSIGKSVLNVYLGVEEGKIVSLPTIVDINYNMSMEQNVIEKMLSLKSSYGYFPLIPAGTKLNSISATERECNIDLSSEFFIEGKNIKSELAMKALAAAIIDIGNIDYVTISVNGTVIKRNIVKDHSLIIN